MSLFPSEEGVGDHKIIHVAELKEPQPNVVQTVGCYSS